MKKIFPTRKTNNFSLVKYDKKKVRSQVLDSAMNRTIVAGKYYFMNEKWLECFRNMPRKHF